MNFYQLVGPVDPEKDIGKDITLSFNFGSVRNNSEEAVLSGHILCMIPFGHFPQTDTESAKESEKELLDWCSDTGLLKPTDKFYKELTRTHFGQATALCLPNIHPRDSKLFSLMLVITVAVDSAITRMKQGKLFHLFEIGRAFDSFVAISQGDYSSLDQIPKSDLPLFEVICGLLIIFRQRAIATKMDISHLVHEMIDYLMAQLLELKHASNTEPNSYTKDDYMFERPFTLGGSAYIETMNLVNRITLSQKVRQDITFRKYLYQVNMAIILPNDLYSLKKEISEGEMDNLVLIEHKKYSLQKSIQKVNERLNRLILDLKKTSKALKERFHDDVNVSAFIKNTHYFLDGHLYWSECCERYGDVQFSRYLVEYNNGETPLSNISSKKIYPFFNTKVDKLSVSDKNNSIKHLAIIPDGNRRWAKENGLSIEQAHQKTLNNFIDLVKAGWNAGIHTLTFWVLSSDNLKREPDELASAFLIIEKTIEWSLVLCRDVNAKLNHLGSKEFLPKSLVGKLIHVEQETQNNSKHVLNLAINYGGRQELVYAANQFLEQKPTDKITEAQFSKLLYNSSQPYPEPDLIIRTGCSHKNMFRLSGFMPWQGIYSELRFLQKMFQDFKSENLQEELSNFSSVQRRFGC